MVETLKEKNARGAVPPKRRLVHVLNYDDLLTVSTQSFAIPDALPLTLGRAADGPLRLHGRRLEAVDGWLSTNHAELSDQGGALVVKDLNSRNGVWVNGARVAEHPLQDGDLLELGHGLWVYRVAPAEQVDALEGRTQGVLLGPTRTFCPEVAALVMDLERLAPSNQSVLVLAETGSGKESFAHAVHALSGRKGAFVAVDCGAVPESLFESTFFGHKKGAFTGANEARTGELVRADGGTLFLDEVANMTHASQAKLLRVLEDGKVTPLGASEPVQVDVRVVTATNRELFGDDSVLRTDLLRRLAGYTARLPPLRKRKEDLGTLTAHLLKEAGVKKAAITSAAGRALFGSDFEGNIRQLKSTLRSAALLAGEGEIDVAHLPATSAPVAARVGNETMYSGKRAVAPEKADLEAALTAAKGNVVHVAKALGTHARQIYRWAEKLGVDVKKYR